MDLAPVCAENTFVPYRYATKVSTLKSLYAAEAFHHKSRLWKQRQTWYSHQSLFSVWIEGVTGIVLQHCFLLITRMALGLAAAAIFPSVLEGKGWDRRG